MNELAQKEPGQLVASTPTDMIMWAMQNGANVEQLERLMALKERHDQGEARKAFVKAMSDFRGGQKPIAKTRKGHNCTYAGLAETIEQITPLLAECGLSHRWETKQEGGSIVVTCHLTHVDGHSESATMSSGADTSGQKNQIQAIGSAISYLQRYTLYAVCGLASREMDDDGAGVGRGNKKTFDLEAALKEIAECDSLDKLRIILQKRGGEATAAKDRPGYDAVKKAATDRSEVLKNG